MQFNINGQIFELSEVSSDFLEKYLQRVRKYIDKNNLESDLYLDIQERISEKFSELSQPISNKTVIDIVNEIGEPEEIFSDLLIDGASASHSKNKFYDGEKIKDFFSEKTTQKLSLSSQDSMIGGVCGGIAQRFGIDSLWVRLAFLIGLFLFGVTFVVYIALWILLPKENKVQNVQPRLQTQKLTLSSQDKMIAGVCGGIAQRLFIDPLWIRLGFIIGAFFFGITFVIYIALWILLPKKNDYKPSQIVQDSKKNLVEVKNKSSGIFGKIFQSVKKILQFLFKSFTLIFAGIIIFGCIAPILFFMGLLFTDFQVYNQVLFENVDPYLITGISLFLFMLLFFILGLIWKIFQGKIIANMLMITGLLGSFIAIFISGIGFFQSMIHYSDTYTMTQEIPLDNYNNETINIYAFGESYENNFLQVNWADSIEFRLTNGENPYVEIQSVINHGSQEEAKKYFENMQDFTVEKFGSDIFIDIDKIFIEKTSYQFLRRNIILYVPENQSIRLGDITYAPLYNRIYVQDEAYNYGLWYCINKNISYLQDKQNFTCN